MGVHGLWELLAPVGRRVSVETLAGKKLAIDASIWLVQFMKAMRDERGDMVRNAHLIGFFRRICKLLFLRTKPVFVFDGGTPALKRRTVIARRRQRENAQAKIRKTAEKLLLNHLKAMRLKELANDIENQKQKNDLKGKNVVSADSEVTENISKTDEKVNKGYDQESLDELLAASLAAEEDGSFNTNASPTVGGVTFEEEDDDEEEMVLPAVHGKVDPSVLASLPPSMQLDLLVQMREGLMAENRQKYQKVKKVPAKFSELQIQSYLKTVAFRREINEVQKAAAGRGVGGMQTSRIASEANREFIFSSSFTGDKEILATAGVDKDGETGRPALGKEPASSDSVNQVSSIAQTSSAGSGINELTRDSHDDVETFLDERGRVRVSRVRAMGIHMTRDLQRNLDLIKEIEHDKLKQISSSNLASIAKADIVDCLERFPENNCLPEAPYKKSDDIISLDDANLLVREKNQKIYEQPIVESIEISFLEDKNKCGSTNDDVDYLFAHLVAGNSVMVSSAENVSSGKPSCVTASDCIWKKGIDEEKDDTFGNGPGEKTQPPLPIENSDESEVDWVEGDISVPINASPCPPELKNAVRRGSLEEEADIQEAIRRSLKDSSKEKSNVTSIVDKNTGSSREIVNSATDIEFPCPTSPAAKDRGHFLNLAREDEPLQFEISVEDMAGPENLNQLGDKDILQINDSSEGQLTSSTELKTKIDEKAEPLDKPYAGYPPSSVRVSNEETSESAIVYMEIPCRGPVNPSAPSKVHLIADEHLDTSNEAGMVASLTGSNGISQSSAAVMNDKPKVIFVDASRDDSEALPTFHSYETTDHANSQVKSSASEVAPNDDIDQNIFAENNLERTRDTSSIEDNMEIQMELTGASLDEEMLMLREERINLGEEQRKLERNAESVSSEMFAECQELLQMFGIPYIIAPMEAEAQCAYMELANLVDGVVTDDSDVFLFGAQSVYKNIFDERKYVETYFMKDIESELGLSREQLIRMALLLGSDYTEGVSGIGIVNAIEVVHAFPEQDGLQKFREWLESPDPNILGNLDAQSKSSSRKRGSKKISSDADCMKNDVGGGISVDKSISQGHDAASSMDDIPKIKQIFMDKHRNVSKNWHISASFPSETVISAYVSPQVDKSSEPFSWGKPDLFVLRKLCWEKFGWSNQKANDLLVPVLKEYNKHETQLRLEAFYTFNERFAKIRSRRIKKAVKGITGKRPSEFMDDLPKENSKSRRNGTGPSEPVENQSENSLDADKDSLAEKKSSTPEESTSIQSRKRTEYEPMSSEVRKEGRGNSKRGLSGNVRGRGRGRRRGRGRGRGIGSCKESLQYQSAESSCTDGSDDNVLEMQEKTTESSSKVRRSSRPRKQVQYTADDAEADGLTESSDRNNQSLTDAAVEQEKSHSEGMLEGAAYELNDGRSSILNDVVHRDHFEMGGGFCMDEAEPENEPIELVFNLTKDCDLETDGPLTNDYLNTGGGFCMVEGEPGSNTVPSVSSPTRDSNELRDKGKRKLDASGTIQTSLTNHVYDNAGNVDSMLLEETDTARISTTTGLSAMPLLRRKRRKT